MNMQKPRRKGFDRVKVAEMAVAAVLLVILAVVIAGYVPLSHPLLTQKTVAIAKKIGADTCTIGNVRAALWKGVSLHEVAMAGALTQGRRYSVQVRKLSLGANCARLALRQGAIRSAMAKEAAGLERAAAQDPAAALHRLLGAAAAQAGVRGVGVDKADARFTDKQGEAFSGQQMTVHVEFNAAESLQTRGTCSAARLGTRGINMLGDMNAAFSSHGDVFTVSNFRAKCFEGKIRGDGRFDFGRNRLTGCTVSVAGVNINSWYVKTDTTNGRCRGKADCRVFLDSSAMAMDSLRGKGTISIGHFEVSGFPFQKTLVSLLLYPPIMRLKFNRFKCDFTLKEGGVFTTEMTGDGDSLDIKASGAITMAGRVNQKFVCTLSKEAVGTLPDLAQKTLEDAPDGGRILRFRIYGRLANPKFEIESEIILQKAVKNVFEDVKQNLQMWLK